MSLINDALKRARESDKKRPSGPPPMRPLLPVEGANGGQFAWILPLIVVIVLALSGWFFWKWHQASHHVVLAKAAPTLAVKAATAPAAAPKPVPAPTPVASAPVVPRPAPVAAKPAKPPETEPAPPAIETPWPTPLTLQAIIYSKTHPTALINGKPVGPGDSVAGVVVAKIERTSVTLQWNGHSKEFFLNAN
ncbi:MAG: hypothetical protein ACLQVY_17860 [Limisphaerales bacterium]